MAITSKIYLSLSSGNIEPSANDIAFTKRLASCGQLMGIELLDHLVIGEDYYCSLKERNLF
ncbi:JAB domain-containing protein [Vagococcus intermedius]|uniref:DNA repair protein n=1 Tax=Vagococcus intermedius TaxID=2991418 RepID=A0AAF0CW54_9ENTE|nr:JAB domain-containing protein [Vagococcus intermedius]WEG73926.1 DNA repair protein [Vagococcus intermedius]WEG76007.1 DNA repair protein [Vagococcus intermedius]